jgi:hypothetical protein
VINSSKKKPFLPTPPACDKKSRRSALLCKDIVDNIEYYTALKKHGGSARSMTEWQKERNKYEDEYTKNNCRMIRSKL